jgi:cell pole-organizing protein PopZ
VQAATAAARSLGSPPEPSLPASIATAVTAAAAASLASSGASARPAGQTAQTAPEGRSTVPSTTRSDEPGSAPAPDQKLGKSEASRPATGTVEPDKLAPRNATIESPASAAPSPSAQKSATPWIPGDAAGKSAPAETGDNSKNVRLADAPPNAEAGKPQASDPQMLEDILADLLRPMVRKWLDENMTRALEKAVRIEVADGVLDVVSKLNSTTKT